jgi:hypothetical protein
MRAIYPVICSRDLKAKGVKGKMKEKGKYLRAGCAI